MYFFCLRGTQTNCNCLMLISYHFHLIWSIMINDSRATSDEGKKSFKAITALTFAINCDQISRNVSANRLVWSKVVTFLRPISETLPTKAQPRVKIVFLSWKNTCLVRTLYNVKLCIHSIHVLLFRLYTTDFVSELK